MISPRFGDACRDSANTDLSPKLHTDACLGVAVLKVVNKLRDVLDGVDVMMWWWTDQTDTRR